VKPVSAQGYRLKMHRELVKDRAAEADLIGIWLYTFTDEEIRIRRVLHEIMDVGRHL